MTEAEGPRAAAGLAGGRDLEACITEQPWQKVPGEGWSVTRDLQGWRFRLEPIPAGLHLRGWPPGGG